MVGPDPRPASRDYLRSEIRGLKAEILMWMVGMFIAFCSLIFWVMNNSHNALDEKITTIKSSLKGDIADNKALIQENKILIQGNTALVQGNKALIQENKLLIQKVLDNQNR